MGNRLPIDYFVKEVETPLGSLGEVRKDLGLSSNKKFKFTHEGLGR